MIEYYHGARRANAVAWEGGKPLRFRKFDAEFRGITDDRRLAPRSPGADGAFLMGFRDAACFIMAAGLLMLAVTLALQAGAQSEGRDHRRAGGGIRL